MRYTGFELKQCVFNKARQNDTIIYVNVMSLYPYICEYFNFLFGHRIIHVGDACKNKEACLQMEGLIKCSIIPPMNLYQPVLPYRSKNNLLFCLCRSCVFERNIFGECKHRKDYEIALTETWVLDEVLLAVEKFIESSISTRFPNTKLPNTVAKQPKVGFS